MGSSNVHQTRDVTPIPALEGGSAGFVTISLLVPTTIPLPLTTAMFYYCLRFASDQTTLTKSSNEGVERFPRHPDQHQLIMEDWRSNQRGRSEGMSRCTEKLQEV